MHGLPGVEAVGVDAKKKSLIAAEQLRIDVMRRRHHFAIARRFVEPQRWVFLDESGAQSNLTTRYGRSPQGQRCIDHTPHGHRQNTTLLSAIRSEGVIQQATVQIDGAMDAAVFRGYVEHCLAPALRPGDIVVMDNLQSHKDADVIRAIEAVGAGVWFLPPYSPDLNPIEKLWSKVKARLRRAQARNFNTLGQAFAQALQAVQPDECLNYFRSCGYCQK